MDKVMADKWAALMACHWVGLSASEMAWKLVDWTVAQMASIGVVGLVVVTAV